MRARRLISLLLLLQNRGHGTAAELADELGVSVRTVYRDLEALGSAGIPVTTEPGPGGGCRLLGGYRTQLTGLDAGEAEALFLSGLPGPAAELGLGSLLARAQRKVLAALPARLREAARLADQRFHLDPRNWFQPQPEHPALEALAQAVWSDRRVRFAYARGDGRAVEREGDAVALALKSGLWYLVARVGADLRVYRVSRISSVVVRDASFARDPGFDLGAFWSEWAARFENGLAAIPVTRARRAAARSSASRAWAIRRRAPPANAEPTLESDGWLRRVLVFEKLEYARAQLLGFGADVEVLEPVELRAQLAGAARALAGAIRWRASARSRGDAHGHDHEEEEPPSRSRARRSDPRCRSHPRRALRSARSRRACATSPSRSARSSADCARPSARSRPTRASASRSCARKDERSSARCRRRAARSRARCAKPRRCWRRSWDEIKQSADAVLGDARAAASSFASRIRDAIRAERETLSPLSRRSRPSPAREPRPRTRPRRSSA